MEFLTPNEKKKRTEKNLTLNLSSRHCIVLVRFAVFENGGDGEVMWNGVLTCYLGLQILEFPFFCILCFGDGKNVFVC